jgi:hypothetical protein
MESADMALVTVIGIFCVAYLLNNIVNSWRVVQLAKRSSAEDSEGTTKEQSVG